MPVFAALADPTRRRIVETLANGQLSANEVVSLFDISQPSVSRHLRILREANLVRVHQRGRERIYQLNPEPLGEMERWLGGFRHFWAGRLDALEEHLSKKDA